MKAQCSGWVGTHYWLVQLEGSSRLSRFKPVMLRPLCAVNQGKKRRNPTQFPGRVQGVRGPEKSLWIWFF